MVIIVFSIEAMRNAMLLAIGKIQEEGAQDIDKFYCYFLLG